MKFILLSTFLTTLNVFGQKDPFLVVGTYTSGASEGMYVYRFDINSGQARLVSSAPSSNPSYLAVSKNGSIVYVVNENADPIGDTVGGSVSAFSFNRTNGQLEFLNSQYSGGKHPCYVSIDKTGRWVTAGNYSSGSLAIFPIQKDGRLGELVQSVEHEGYSVNTARQQEPHVHATVFSPDNKTLFVPDLGIDKVMIYDFNAASGKISPAPVPFTITEAGAGPRHFEFHPSGKYAYLMEELSGSISVYKYNSGELDLLQNISALPGDYDGPVGSADIHVSPDGKFLYASNRGESNTIAIFSIDKTGRLTTVGHQSTLGRTPRNFNFDPTGNFLLVANQNSDEIVIFKRNKQTGLLTDTGNRIKVSKPVCLKWIKS